MCLLSAWEEFITALITAYIIHTSTGGKASSKETTTKTQTWCEDDIKVDLREAEWDDMITNIRVPRNDRKFLLIWLTGGFSRTDPNRVTFV
jgi:hypothetical protein